MDKILSTRVDESVVHQIGLLARHLCTSKKQIIENAILTYAAKIDESKKLDPLEQTCGAWRRRESADKIITAVRTAFNQSMGSPRR
jgi:hypothetical protein